MPSNQFAGSNIPYPKFKAATAARAVLASESGVYFTTRGATQAITFTLPAVTNLPIGTMYRFYSVSAYGMAVASNGSLDNILTLNEVAADSITCTTTSLMIGTVIEVIWDGVKWLSFKSSGGTYTTA